MAKFRGRDWIFSPNYYLNGIILSVSNYAF